VLARQSFTAYAYVSEVTPPIVCVNSKTREKRFILRKVPIVNIDDFMYDDL